MILTKEQILASDDLPKKEVDVPEWGGSVIVRTMTGTERDKFEQSVIGKDMSNLRASLLSLCLINDKGVHLFNDAVQLGQKSSVVLQRLYDVACKLNGFGKQEEEELLKN
jgi:hypothetical protein